MWWFLKIDKVRNILPPKDPDGHFSNIKDKVVLQSLHRYNKSYIASMFYNTYFCHLMLIKFS